MGRACDPNVLVSEAFQDLFASLGIFLPASGALEDKRSVCEFRLSPRHTREIGFNGRNAMSVFEAPAYDRSTVTNRKGTWGSRKARWLSEGGVGAGIAVAVAVAVAVSVAVAVAVAVAAEVRHR